MVESNVFQHKAVCMILEALNPHQEEAYWDNYYCLYPSPYEGSDERSEEGSLRTDQKTSQILNSIL